MVKKAKTKETPAKKVTALKNPPPSRHWGQAKFVNTIKNVRVNYYLNGDGSYTVIFPGYQRVGWGAKVIKNKKGQWVFAPNAIQDWKQYESAIDSQIKRYEEAEKNKNL